MNLTGIAALILATSTGLATEGCCKKILQYDYEHPPTIVDKQYDPEREYVGKTGDLLRDDEDYILTIGSTDGRQYPLYVPKEVYEKVKIGEIVDLTKIKHQLLDPDYVNINGGRK